MTEGLYCGGVCERWMCDGGALLWGGVRGGCVTEGLCCGGV